MKEIQASALPRHVRQMLFSRGVSKVFICPRCSTYTAWQGMDTEVCSLCDDGTGPLPMDLYQCEYCDYYLSDKVWRMEREMERERREKMEQEQREAARRTPGEGLINQLVGAGWDRICEAMRGAGRRMIDDPASLVSFLRQAADAIEKRKDYFNGRGEKKDA
jgi:hypothetical protein